MPEKVSSKIKRLESELSEEIGRTIELSSAVRSQGQLISRFLNYFVANGLAEDFDHAIQVVRDYSTSNQNPDQLSLDLE